MIHLLDSYKRFSKSEDLTFDGSFLAIPLMYGNQNFGDLCFESLKEKCLYKFRCKISEELGSHNILYYIFTFFTNSS